MAVVVYPSLLIIIVIVVVIILASMDHGSAFFSSLVMCQVFPKLFAKIIFLEPHNNLLRQIICLLKMKLKESEVL